MASVVCWVLLLTASLATNAQNVNVTSGEPLNSTGNILNLGGGLPWNNTVTGSAGGYSGGWTPAYNPSTGNIIFGYTPQTVSQTVAISHALANAGSGVQLEGYNYSWGINNELSNGGGNRGTITGNVSLKGTNGQTLESFNYNYNGIDTGAGNFQQYNGTQLFNNKYDVSEAGSVTVSFTGKDQNYWAGYYGPRVHVNSFSLLYGVNPCAANPAYSTTCPGFSSLLTSANLVSNPNAVATPGNPVDNSFAISTALSNSGSGLSLYGINYGYTYNLPTTATTGYVTVGIGNNITAGVGGFTRQLNGPTQGAQTASYQLLTPSAINTNTMGTFNFLAGVDGAGASIYNMTASLIVMPDACTLNPLSSTSCTGYAKAYAAQQAQLQQQQQAAAQAAALAAVSAAVTAQTSTVLAAATQPPPAADQPPVAQVAPQAANNSPQQGGNPTQQAAGPTPDPNSQQQPQQQQQAVAQNGAPPPAAPVTSAAPSATNPQPKPGDVQVAGSTKPPGPSESKSSGPSALAMSVVSKEQAKVAATTAAVVAQANDAAASATSQALTTALTVAGSAQATSISASMATATTTSSSSKTTTTSQSTTSVVTLQGNAQTSVVSVNNQRSMENSVATTTATNNTQTASSLPPVRNTTSTSAQTTMTFAQQNESQNLPTPNKQQEVLQVNMQQMQVSSLPPVAPKQQEFVQVNTQQLQTTSLPPVAPKQQDFTPVVVQQTMVATTVEPPKQVQTTFEQTQVAMVNTVQQQSYQPIQNEVVISQYVPPPQPVNTQSSSFVDYSITVQTNLDSLKKTNIVALTEVEVPKVETMKVGTRSVLSDYMNAQAFMALQGAEQTQDGMIKRNVQPNEVANGVDIASIAIQPKGYDAYTKVTLVDAKFYESKEVYKNQEVVDNRRALRGLGSDAKWQRMVDEQYKLGE